MAGFFVASMSLQLVDVYVTEIWLPIQDHDAYEVSSLGRIRRSKSGPQTFIGKILKTRINPRGYETVNLHLCGVKKCHTVHKLVAQAFLTDYSDEKTQINHKDGCKANNVVENLEWVTCSENVTHGYRNGLYPKTRKKRSIA